MHKGGIVRVGSFATLATLSFPVACSDGTAGGESEPACGTAVEDAQLQQCATCSLTATCQPATPLDACCSWASAPPNALIDATGLHRFSAPTGTSPDLACLSTVPSRTAPQTVTLTGYVWLFASGQDSAGVQVDVFAENDPNTDGSFAPTALGTYTTSAMDPIDPTDTSWNSECSGGCSYRQYTIPNLPTETPLVLKTSDGGSMQWATRYEYNVTLSSSAVQDGTVSLDAEAIAGADLVTFAASAQQTVEPGDGLLMGEVRDCSDVRLAGATVGTNATAGSQVYYFTGDESEPSLSLEQTDTSVLGFYGLINVPTQSPVRVSAVAQDPSNAGQYLMLGTYTVQVFPGAVTALVLQGRRPWQP